MSDVAIIIPVYKRRLNKDEKTSFIQTLTMLSNHTIILVCSNDLDTKEYIENAEEVGASVIQEHFESEYFTSISGYNRLLLSQEFYDRFKDYDYILICQTDTYVFKDEIEEWCKKGYDYVGAPLVGKYTDDSFSEKMQVGNGGLSLRKVETFRKYFRGKANVIPILKISSRINFSQKPYTRWLVWFLMAFGWRNKPKSLAKRWKYNEDTFWSIFLDATNYSLYKPSAKEAAYFAFERFPSNLMEITNGDLPMGCHAWKKYQYEEFWKQYIELL